MEVETPVLLAHVIEDSTDIQLNVSMNIHQCKTVQALLLH
jgi:hypothetical protein